MEQTAAIFAALAAASQPFDAKALAAQFKRSKTTEKKVGEVLASLARLGYVTSRDSKTFALRRVAWSIFHVIGSILRDASLRDAPQDEVSDPHGEERDFARLEP